MSDQSKMIDFPKEAKAAFEFLLQRYGFRLAAETPRRMRYESKNVFIEIYYGENDCEVAIEFGRLGTDERYSFTLYLQSINPTLEKQLGERIAYDLDAVRRDLVNLERTLASEGERILTGESSVFDQMKNVRWWDFQPDVLNRPRR